MPRPLASVLQIPSRRLPVPDHVSPELQAAILSSCKKDAPPKITVDSWLRYGGDEIAQRGRIEDLARSKGVRLETMKIGGVTCYLITPQELPALRRGRMLLALHAGGYMLGAGIGGTGEAIQLAAACNTVTLAVDYRMPPHFPFPAPMDDVMSVWRAVVREHDSATMAICGSSSGGGMALCLAQRARDERIPMPAAIVAGTPWSDLSKSGDSYFINDFGLGGYDGPLEAMARSYAGDLDLKDPLISPIYGSFEGFPPTMLISGTRDLFLSNTVRVDHKLRDAGCESELLVLEGHGHATYLDPNLPESDWVFAQIARFIDRHLQS